MIPQLDDTGKSMNDMSGSLDALTPSVNYSEFDDLEAQSAATDEILNSEDVNAEGELTKSGLDKFKSMFGENFNPLMAAGKIAFNDFIGAPVTLAFDALKAIGGMLPDRDPRQGALEDLYDVDGTKIKSGLMKDYNIVSGNPLNPTYGLQNAYQRRLETINKALGKMNLEEYKNTDLVQRKIDLEKAMADEKTMLDQLQYGDPKEIATGIQAAEDDSGSEMLDTRTDQDIINRGGGDEILTGGLDRNRGQQVERGTSGIGDNQPVTSTTKPGELSTSTYDAELEDERDVGGGGNQGGGSKIVCTMMNDSYGFGSFRNKIWLRHSKDLAPEYQIGYHKIFLPLVKLSKTNKILKKTLEHIAVHRTIDIRQEARGKMHLLGRVYRKILEPICYIVGKHAKR
jgi:hypothetical protein